MYQTNVSKKIAFLFLCLAMIICYGCGVDISDKKEIINAQIDYDNIKKTVYDASNNENQEFLVKEYDITCDKNQEIADIAEAGSNLYFFKMIPLPMCETIEKCDLMKVDIQSGQESLVHRFDKPERFYINELISTNDYLFWVELQYDWKIQKYSISSKEISTVKESDDMTQTIVLSSDESYVTWYETAQNGSISLYAYDISNNEIKLISEDIAEQSPFTRAFIKDSRVAYVTQPAENFIFNVYDLAENKLIATIDIGNKYIEDHTCNKNYCMWTLYPFYYNTDLYAYNLSNNQLIQVNAKNNALKIFSCSLINDKVFINDRNTNDILCRNLTDITEINLTSELEEDHTYIFGQTTPNLSYIALDCLPNNSYKILRIGISGVTKPQ